MGEEAGAEAGAEVGAEEGVEVGVDAGAESEVGAGAESGAEAMGKSSERYGFSLELPCQEASSQTEATLILSNSDWLTSLANSWMVAWAFLTKK